MSRQVTTMLFADIVDSTETLARLGDARWAALRARHRALAAEALATYGGREIGSSGDDLFAVFDVPAHALRCAAMLQSRADELGLTLRAGVHCGEIELIGPDVAGLNVHVTARIMAAAEPGEVLVSSTVRDLVGGTGLGFLDRGAHALRGVTETWRLFALDLDSLPPEPDGADELLRWRAPLPPATATDGVRLVGRLGELTVLRRLWSEVAAGESRAAVVGGEPGGGKTRLLAEFAQEVHAQGGFVLWGRCDEGLAVPFQPLVEALDHFVAHLPPARRRAYLAHDAAELARLVPRIRQSMPEAGDPLASDPGTQQYRLFEATSDVLGRVSADVPTLLVVDDAHWATVPTLRFLRHLVQRMPGSRLMVAVTYRDTAPDLSEQVVDWLADVSRLGDVQRLVLDGLTKEAIADLVGVVVSDADDPMALASRIHRRTGGNPFFATQVMRHLGETESPAGVVDERGLPPAIIDVITQRLARLPADTRQVLHEAAVLGQQFSLEVLALMRADLSMPGVLRALDPAIEAHLISEDAGGQLRYRFSHALVVDAIVGTSPRGWLRDAHLRAAEAWEAQSTRNQEWATGELARHYAEASLDVAKELWYSAAAGEAAMAALAYSDAVSFYQQALNAAVRTEVAPIELTRLRLHLALAQAAAGDAAYQETLHQVWDEAVALGDSSLLVQSALAVMRGNWSSSGEVDQRRVAVLEAALASGPLTDATRARLVAELATELTWAQSQRSRREALADEALLLADAIEDVDERFRVIGQCASAVQHPDNAYRLGVLLDAVEGELDTMQDPVVSLQASWTWLAYAGIRADPHRIRHHMARLEWLVECQPVPLAIYLATWIRLSVQFLQGRFDDVLAGCERLLELGAALGQAEAGSIVAYYHLLIGHLRGQTEELLPLLEAYAVDYREGLPGLHAAVAMFHATTGNSARALELLDELSADDYHVLRQDQSTILWLAWAADTAHRVGSVGHAERLYRIMSPYSGQLAFNGGYVVGTVDHWLGLLADTFGDVEASHRHFDAAMATQESIGMTYWVLASSAARACTDLRRGDVGRLGELQALRAVAEAHDHGLIVADIDAQLQGLQRLRAVTQVDGRNRPATSV